MNAVQTERAVIGAILCVEDAMATCTQRGVDETWFSSLARRTIYNICNAMFIAGTPINLVTVSERIGPENETEPFALEDYVDEHFTAAYLDSYLNDLSAARQARIGAQRLEDGVLALKNADLDDVPSLLSGIASSLTDIRAEERDSRGLGDIGLALVDSWQAETKPASMLSWPLPKLNELMGYLTDEFVFIAAKESVGKTAFALNIITSLAHAGIQSSLASLESTKTKVVQRLIAIIGQVNTVSLRNKTALESSYASAREAAKKLDAMPIRISDTPATVDQLLAWAKCEKKAGSKILAIDNMRHIRPGQKYASPVEQFRDLSVRLKWIRDDTGLPLIVLHHLTDDLDVSWSRDIRRDADILLYLIENETYSIKPTQENQWTEKSVIDFEVRKNREGLRGFKVLGEFDKKRQTFTEYA